MDDGKRMLRCTKERAKKSREKFWFQDESGNWEVDEDQTMKMKCDFVISAFGSGLYSQDLKSAMAPLKLTRWGTPEVAIYNTNNV